MPPASRVATEAARARQTPHAPTPATRRGASSRLATDQETTPNDDDAHDDPSPTRADPFAPPPPPRDASASATSLSAWKVPLLVAALAATVVPLVVLVIYAELHTYRCPPDVKTSMRTLRSAVDAWRVARGAYGCPDFATLVADRALAPGPIPRDNWGTPFRVTCIGDETYVRSAGRDRRFDTADDLVVPEPPVAATRATPR